MAAPVVVSDEIGARTYAWIDVIRRARLTPTTKLVAHTVASYAKPDGTNVYPGLARLVFDCGIGYSTARRSLAELRTAGLLELVDRGNRRRREADHYRLTIGPDLLDRVEVPSPEQARRSIESINAHVTGSGRERQRRISALVDSANPGSDDSNPVDNPPDDDQDADELALTQTNHETRSNAHTGPGLALAPARPTSHRQQARKRDQPSSLADDHQSASTGRQPPILGVIDGDHDSKPISAHPPPAVCAGCSMPLNRGGSCDRCETWSDMTPAIHRLTRTGATA